jgi:hypothetical protein
MRKRLISPIRKTDASAGRGWLELQRAALVEVTSEADAYPIEGALLNDQERGWRAGVPGIQTIRLLFDTPQTIQTIRVVFKEEEIVRTQEFVLRWLPYGAGSERYINALRYKTWLMANRSVKLQVSLRPACCQRNFPRIAVASFKQMKFYSHCRERSRLTRSH